MLRLSVTQSFADCRQCALETLLVSTDEDKAMLDAVAMAWRQSEATEDDFEQLRNSEWSGKSAKLISSMSSLKSSWLKWNTVAGSTSIFVAFALELSLHCNLVSLIFETLLETVPLNSHWTFDLGCILTQTVGAVAELEVRGQCCRSVSTCKAAWIMS